MPRSNYYLACQLMRASDELKSAYNSHGLMYVLRRSVEELLIRTPLLKNVYWKFAPLYFGAKYERGENFSAPLNVLKLIYVDPREIINFSGRDLTIGTDRKLNIGKVLPGDWDKHYNRKLTDDYIYRSILDRFKNDTPWKETELYTIESKRIREVGEGNWHGCNNERDLEKRFAKIDELYANINDKGYKHSFHRKCEENLSFQNCLLNEVTIDIGRNGELLFVDGRHRLAIAKTLDLKRIPVFVLVRHEKWMETRDAIYEGECNMNHPDISEF